MTVPHSLDMRMPPQLVALNEGANIVLDKPILLLGRHSECDVQIHSRKISRRHCCIAKVNDYLMVRDLGSTNGIRINGVRVEEGRLGDGDELTVGNCRYRIQWSDQPKTRNATQQAHPADKDLEACDEPVPLDDSDPSTEKLQNPSL